MSSLPVRRTRLAIVFCGLLLSLLYGCSSDDNDPTSSGNSAPTLETGTVTDIDGNTYQTVKIGDQWWMAENLRVTHYRNGDPIEKMHDDTIWFAAGYGGFSDVDKDSTHRALYGLLYNGFALADPRGVAPDGWHLPSDSEWQVLEDHLGAGTAGGQTKSTGTSLWTSPNLGATNESGFSALPAGVRVPAGGFSDRGNIAFFWTSTQAIGPPIVHWWLRGMGYAETTLRRQAAPHQMGLSVRCVKD